MMIDSPMTRQGRLSGLATAGGSAFLGIPYAAPPVGDLRWRPPLTPHSWQGTRDAKRYASVPIQRLPDERSLYHPGALPQSEDCLTLNVWTNARTSAERRPVMVWFHMGAFLFGSSAWTSAPGDKHLFDGSNLAELGVVVVTVNYRLGRLGFLAHSWLTAESDHGASGNYGFMDQVAALQWVRNNIDQFGGDPENVTIFGVSAGSASGSMHMASPLSKGMFHRAIGFSGGFMSPPAKDSGLFDRLLDLPSAEARGRELSDALEASNMATLRSLPSEAIMAAPISSDARAWHMGAIGIDVGEGVADTGYPIIDGYALPASPESIFRAGQHNDVPLMTGSNLDERSGLPAIRALADYEQYLRTDMGALADQALRIWPARDDAEAVRASGDLLADRVFSWQNWTWAQLARAKGTHPVFYHDWYHPLPLPAGRYIESDFGPVHGAQMPYLFRNLDAFDWDWTEADRTLSDRFSRYCVNFARTGDPNGEELLYWPAFEGQDGPSMRMSAAPAPNLPRGRDRYAVLDAYYSGLEE